MKVVRFGDSARVNIINSLTFVRAFAKFFRFHQKWAIVFKKLTTTEISFIQPRRLAALRPLQKARAGFVIQFGQMHSKSCVRNHGSVLQAQSQTFRCAPWHQAFSYVIPLRLFKELGTTQREEAHLFILVPWKTCTWPKRNCLLRRITVVMFGASV